MSVVLDGLPSLCHYHDFHMSHKLRMALELAIIQLLHFSRHKQCCNYSNPCKSSSRPWEDGSISLHPIGLPGLIMCPGHRYVQHSHLHAGLHRIVNCFDLQNQELLKLALSSVLGLSQDPFSPSGCICNIVHTYVLQQYLSLSMPGAMLRAALYCVAWCSVPLDNIDCTQDTPQLLTQHDDQPSQECLMPPEYSFLQKGKHHNVRGM